MGWSRQGSTRQIWEHNPSYLEFIYAFFSSLRQGCLLQSGLFPPVEKAFKGLLTSGLLCTMLCALIFTTAHGRSVIVLGLFMPLSHLWEITPFLNCKQKKKNVASLNNIVSPNYIYGFGCNLVPCYFQSAAGFVVSGSEIGVITQIPRGRCNINMVALSRPFLSVAFSPSTVCRCWFSQRPGPTESSRAPCCQDLPPIHVPSHAYPSKAFIQRALHRWK